MRAFVGFGELGRQVEAFLSEESGAVDAVYFDDGLNAGREAGAEPFSRFEDPEFRDYDFYVCLGYRQFSAKLSIVQQLASLGRRTPKFVHPSCHVSGSAEVGAGTIIYPMSLLDKNVQIGAGVLINNAVIVSHDSRIGNCSYLSPGVVVCGEVEIGEGVFLGAGTSVSNGVTIGDSAIVGIGTVVTADVPSGASVVGNPMKLVSSRLRI